MQIIVNLQKMHLNEIWKLEILFLKFNFLRLIAKLDIKTYLLIY